EYINALLKTGNPELARKTLLSLPANIQQQPIYTQLMAQVYGDLGQPAESHRYLADYYYAIGQTKDAILQIRLAQKSKGLNFQLSSILNERLRFFLDKQEEEMRSR
ncbi:MAG: M48 family peptidase, partial [Methylococcaceae bacterium]|nr:M48 family peptidase [Methylococcaceae bacterium]